MAVNKILELLRRSSRGLTANEITEMTGVGSSEQRKAFSLLSNTGYIVGQYDKDDRNYYFLFRDKDRGETREEQLMRPSDTTRRVE